MVTHSSLTHTPASFPVIKLVGNSILPYMEQFLLIFVNLNHEHKLILSPRSLVALLRSYVALLRIYVALLRSNVT